MVEEGVLESPVVPILAPHLPPLELCSFGFPELCGVEGGHHRSGCGTNEAAAQGQRIRAGVLNAAKTRPFDGVPGTRAQGGAPGLHHSAVQGITRPWVAVPGRRQEQVQMARCRAQPGRRLQTPQYWVLSQGSDRSPGGGGAHGRGTQTPGPERDTGASWVPGQGGQRRGTNDLLLN